MDRQFSVAPWLAWLMWALTCCFYFFEFFLQVSPSVMVPQLMRDFSVSAHAIGSMSACYFYVYAVMQIPAGIMLDRFGARKLLSVATVICALGSIIFGQADGMWMASIGRGLIGFGGAFAAIGSMSVVAAWHPSKRFALLTGSLVGFGMLGAIFGESALAPFVNHFGWRYAMTTLGYIGLGLAVFLWVMIREKPIADHVREMRVIEQLQDLMRGLRTVLTDSQICLIALYGCFYFATTSAFCALWGTPFLMTAYGLTNTKAAMIISFAFAGWTIGSPLGGFVSERIQKRRPVILFTGAMGTLLMSLIVYVHLSLFWMSTCLFLWGLSSGGMVLIFSLGKENAAHENVATAMGFVNCLNMVGGSLLQPGIGALLDHSWKGGMLNGIRAYTVTDFHLALSLLPITLGIAFLMGLFIKETHCQSVYEEKAPEKKPQAQFFEARDPI